MAVDKPAGADTAHAPAQPGKWRLGGALWLLGMPGVVALAGQPSDGLALTVTRITPLAEAREGANTFRVEAALDAPPQGLRPGMEGAAKLEVGEARLVWVWSRRMVDWARRTLWTWQP